MIKTEYVFLRNPQGGYSEVCVRAGMPAEQLPSIEIAVVGGRRLARRRGASPKEHRRFLDCLRAALADGSIDKIELRTAPLSEIGEDPDFWPRISRQPDGKLFLRARDPGEAKFFLTNLRILLATPLVDDYTRWTESNAPGGAAHDFCVRFDIVRVHRALAKIACSLALLCYGELCRKITGFADVCEYVLRGKGERVERATMDLNEFSGLDASADYHYAHLWMKQSRLVCILSIYGARISFDLGRVPERSSWRSITAACKTDGKKCAILNGAVADQVAATVMG